MAVITLKEKCRRMCELKALLKSTDYKAIKYAEGEITAKEYADTLAQRRAWRAEINEIQTLLNYIKENPANGN